MVRVNGAQRAVVLDQLARLVAHARTAHRAVHVELAVHRFAFVAVAVLLLAPELAEHGQHQVLPAALVGSVPVDGVAHCIGGEVRLARVIDVDHQRHSAMGNSFKVNTGCREQEVCKLRWDWEIFVPELNTSVFLIPAEFGGRHENSGVKNRDERLVVLNSVAKSIIDGQRGISREWVFPYNDTGMHRMNDSAWKKARARAAKLWQEQHLRPAHPGFASIRVHDLKHTFGRRLKAAGVSEEDRKSLLGHKNGSVTSHYSGAELGQLIEAANKVSATDSRGPVLTILKRRSR